MKTQIISEINKLKQTRNEKSTELTNMLQENNFSTESALEFNKEISKIDIKLGYWKVAMETNLNDIIEYTTELLLDQSLRVTKLNLDSLIMVEAQAEWLKVARTLV